MDFYEVIRQAATLLQQQGRLTYRTLKRQFNLDDEALEDLKDELLYSHPVRDDEGRGLIWTGESGTKPEPVSTQPVQQEVTQEAQPAQAETSPPELSSPDAERRQLTVMFCDLADSTKLSGQLDPEDLRDVIRAYQETAAGVIQRYEGHIAQYLGDGLLVYFGWPQAHEDDAQRGVHAGLGIIEAMGDLNTRLEKDRGVRLAVRIGIHTGPVVVGEMGGGGRHENLATGETVNITARLEALAAPNTVAVSGVTERLVQRAFALEELGPRVLKGVAEPMKTFRVLGPMADDEEETPTVGIPFLVGRDEEVGLLLRRWAQSKEGLGQVVLISGEAGIGKSSLVAMVRTHVVQEGGTRIVFRCSPYHTNSALYPVITYLEHMLGFDRDDVPETKLDKLEQALRTTTLPLDEAVPLLASLLSVPVVDRYQAPTLSSQQQRQQTLDTLGGWLLEESGRHPVLAVWEDLHWADPSTLEMLGLVLAQAPTVPMLHVLTFRPEFEPPWPPRSHMTPITLNRLERPQVVALIAHLAGDKALPAEVVEHIVAKTDGVPLYVEELTRMLLDSELLREETDQYVLTGPLTTVAIPDTLQDSLMARLDQLHTAKEVAQLGAVLGREFTYEMFQAISSQDEETLQADLAQLVEAELLYQRGRPPRAKYIFKHALIQDAAYQSLLKSTRQRVHQQIARLFEARFPEVIETQPELVAHHYTETDCPEQAIACWQRAGEQANQRSAYTEAVAHLTKGLEILERLPETAARVNREIHLLLALGRPLISAKGNAASEAGHLYTRVRKLCHQGEEPSLHFAALHGLRVFHSSRAEHLQATEVGEEALCIAQHVQDPGLLAEAYLDVGVPLFYRGELCSAVENFRQSLTYADVQQDASVSYSLGGPAAGVVSRAHGCIALWTLGYPEQARQWCHEALTLSQRFTNPRIQVMGQAWSLILYAACRAWPMLHEAANHHVTFSTEHGLPQLALFGTTMLGWWRVVQAHDRDGINQLHQGMQAFQDLRVDALRPYWLAQLAEARAQTGQPEEGLTALEEAFAVMHTTEEYLHHAELHRLKGALSLSCFEDRYAEAEACFHQALDEARNQQAKSWELRAATSLARLWQSQGKRQEAYDLLAPVYGWFTEGFDTADLQEAKALLDELAR